MKGCERKEESRMVSWCPDELLRAMSVGDGDRGLEQRLSAEDGTSSSQPRKGKGVGKSVRVRGGTEGRGRGGKTVTRRNRCSGSDAKTRKTKSKWERPRGRLGL